MYEDTLSRELWPNSFTLVPYVGFPEVETSLLGKFGLAKDNSENMTMMSLYKPLSKSDHKSVIQQHDTPSSFLELGCVCYRMGPEPTWQMSAEGFALGVHLTGHRPSLLLHMFQPSVKCVITPELTKRNWDIWDIYRKGWGEGIKVQVGTFNCRLTTHHSIQGCQIVCV